MRISPTATAHPTLLGHIKISRIDHWFKNVFVLPGIVAAIGADFQHVKPGLWWRILIGTISICLIASSNYVINEILDAPTDRSHPVKRHRPIPSGRVRLGVAYAEWALLGVAGLVMASFLNWPFFWAAAFLLFMGLVYNVPPVRSKELPYVDVVSESINNPIRLLLGWFAVSPAEFPPVSLLIAYWMIGAFFMASKRFSEYRSIAHRETAGAYRSSFRYYDEQKLLVSMFFYVTCFALFLGIFIIRYHLELILIVPLVAGFVSYYLHITFRRDSAAQNPERLYRETGLMAYLALCVASFAGLMFVSIPAMYSWFNVVPSAAPALWKF